ncbi:MAG: Ig-like domain-containing protein, partial [Clostridia bacterium]|nr:Ig-like domain-containing protein [Clostridia bacterium]
EVTYTSSNERVATVDKNGKITAKGNGAANIIAKTTNGKEAVCKVEVQTVATKINMDKNVSIDLSKEKEKKITVEVEPDEAKNKSVMIRSSNEEVATIDANGTIKAKKNGEAIITAEIAGTNIRETCKVTVTTSPTGLKLSQTNVNLDMGGTKSTKITAEVEPSTASNQNIKWTNGNSNIIYMSASGETATLTGLKNGEATITATIDGTNISKQCKIKVTTSPASIKLNKTNVSIELSDNKTTQLTATVLPSSAVNKTVSWSSSNTGVATVDKNGKVTAKKAGEIIITAKTTNNIIATCKVVIKDEKITGGQAIAEAAVKLACTAYPENYIYANETQRIYNNRTKEYVNAKERLLNVKYYASCDVSTSTAVRYSTVDKNFEWDTVIKQWTYLKNSKNWQAVGNFNGTSTSNLKPGDVLIGHHIMIYTGNEIVRKRFPNSPANIYEGSFGLFYPALTRSTRHIGRPVYTIFRHVNSNKKLYDKIL